MNNNRIKQIIREELDVNQEVNEDLFDPIRNVWSGLKGVYRGEGYGYYKYLSQLKNIVRDLKRMDEPNHEKMNKLNELNTNIQGSNLDTRKKRLINGMVLNATNHFKQYSDYIDQINNTLSQKLK